MLIKKLLCHTEGPSIFKALYLFLQVEERDLEESSRNGTWGAITWFRETPLARVAKRFQAQHRAGGTQRTGTGEQHKAASWQQLPSPRSF